MAFDTQRVQVCDQSDQQAKAKKTSGAGREGFLGLLRDPLSSEFRTKANGYPVSILPKDVEFGLLRDPQADESSGSKATLAVRVYAFSFSSYKSKLLTI